MTDDKISFEGINFTIESDNSDEKGIIHEINHILYDLQKYALTAITLTKIRDKFGKCVNDYSNIFKNIENISVISIIVSSIEDSCLICLGRIFDTHAKSMALNKLIDRKFIEILKKYNMFDPLMIFYLHSIEKTPRKDLLEEYMMHMEEKIKTAIDFFKKNKFDIIRNSYIAHANVKNINEYPDMIIGIENSTYIKMSTYILDILFTIIKIFSTNDKKSITSADRFILDTKNNAQFFLESISGSLNLKLNKEDDLPY